MKENNKLGIDGFAWKMKKRLKLKDGHDKLVLVHNNYLSINYLS